MATYATPRDLRAALAAANYDWTAVLTAEQLDQPLLAEEWGGHQTLRSWLADGAETPEGARRAANPVWYLLQGRA